MKIGAFYKSQVVAIDAHESLADAAYQMWANEIGALAVLAEDGHLTGVITERDLVRAMADGLSPRVVPVARYVTDTAAARLEDDCQEVAHRMVEIGVWHLPVVDRGALIGMVSARDLVVLQARPEVAPGPAAA